MQPRSSGFLSMGAHGFHRVACREWGDPENGRVLVCVHGLTRNGLDFEVLAPVLANEWRVVAPDVVGRGLSDRLPVKEGYDYQTYVQDMAALIARLGVDEVDWVGTSMGGIIGMMIAAAPRSPIRRMVLNDIGPVISKAGLERIQTYAGKDPTYPDFDAAYAAIEPNTRAFGPMTPAQRRRFIEIGTCRRPDGSGITMNYDPDIAWAFRDVELEEITMWPLWDAIQCPVFVLRGAESDLLSPETLAEMKRRGPGCTSHEVPGVGHTPALMDDEQLSLVRTFLAAES